MRQDTRYGEPGIWTARHSHSTGTIVDATIIAAPSSTKNSKKERDPQMHQTKKGNQYYFGAKAHIGVDSKEGVVHSVCTSAASVHDKHMLPDLLHGEEKKVWGDAGYQGQTKGDPRGCAQGAGHDQSAREDQARAWMKTRSARTGLSRELEPRWSGPSAS
jgi:IS5 family transposase